MHTAMTLFSIDCFLPRWIVPWISYIYFSNGNFMIHFDDQNVKMMSHYAKILPRDNMFPFLKVLCNYTYQLLQVPIHLRWQCSFWVFHFLKRWINKNHTQDVSSAAVKKIMLPSTWYMEITILNVWNIVQFSLSSKQPWERLFTDFV